MSDTKWRIEKITANHPAYINNPDQCPVGWWFVTNDPCCEDPDWIEFCESTWDEALQRTELFR